ncbi:MAG: hypothetical protein MK207_04120 [Saprospiraceae bacterium]|nr:hypothetical protein [Saprospiraceae bacterium]
MSIQYSQESRIFRDFRCIPYSDYYYLIRFYEQYNTDIDHLPFDQGLIMSYYYANALFETYEYESHIKIANYILEQSIINNIRYIDGDDVYVTTLYKKTYAHMKLGEYDVAKDLAKQLVRITDNNIHCSNLLAQCYREVRPSWVKPVLITSATASLFAAISIILFSFFQEFFAPQLFHVSYALFSLAVIGLSASIFVHYKYVVAPTRKILSQARADRKSDFSKKST